MGAFMCLANAILTHPEVHLSAYMCMYRGSSYNCLGHTSEFISCKKYLYAPVYLVDGLVTPCRVITAIFTVCADMRAATIICFIWVVDGFEACWEVALVRGVLGEW